MRHEGSSVHVSESLTRRGIGHAGSNPGAETRRVTGTAKPWITSILDGQAKLRAVARANPEQASKDESRMPTHPFYGEGHVGQGDPSRTLSRSAGVWGTARNEGGWINVGDPRWAGVATLVPVQDWQPARKSERSMVPMKPVTTAEGRDLTSGCLGSGRGCGD